MAKKVKVKSRIKRGSSKGKKYIEKVTRGVPKALANLQKTGRKVTIILKNKKGWRTKLEKVKVLLAGKKADDNVAFHVPACVKANGFRFSENILTPNLWRVKGITDAKGVSLL